MPPEAVYTVGPRSALLERIPEPWRLPLVRLAIAWIGLFAFFADDWADMFAQWWNSSTYNHILLVPPIIVWLVWQRRGELAKLSPQGWWPGLLLVAAAFFLWLLGAFSGLNLARQLGAVAALQAATITLLGPRVTAGLFFPLCYGFFLVPFGDELVPLLQTITAKLTIVFTHWSGVPAIVDGVFIDTPAGLFEVAEACSGVKFLIAMVALATLVAHICFRSWKRRIAFLAFAIALPILANGIRAWGTIYIAQSQGVEFAEGFDHIVYGWVFFAGVMVILLASAWRFFDRDADDPMIDASSIKASASLASLCQRKMGGWKALGGIAALSLLAAAWLIRASTIAAELPEAVELPEVPGWERIDYAPAIWWEPRAGGADLRMLGSYRDADGNVVDLFVALYSSQNEGKEAGGFGEGALSPDGDWHWLEAGPDFENAKSERLLAFGNFRRLAVTHYRSGELLTGSNTRLKLANMADRLLMRANSTAMLIISAAEQDHHPAEDSIRAFSLAVGPVDEWMDGLVQVP